MDDPRFWVLEEALSSYASDPDDPPIRDDDVLQAAVSVIVRANARMELLLIKRAEHEGDPWSGHMALPGGRRDPSDGTMLDTAVRETREETAIDLADARRLGRLEDVVPSTTRLPELIIHPFVFGVSSNTRARVASPELEAVHWVTLEELRDPRTSSHVEIGLPGGSRTFPCLRVRSEVVWGLTYRILTDFLGRYADGSLGEPD